MFDDLLKALVAQLIRYGTVHSVDGAGLVRVIFDDQDGVVSYDLLPLAQGTSDGKDAVGYKRGDPVVCLFLPDDVSSGFVLGTPQGGLVPRPDVGQEVRVVRGEEVRIGEVDADDPVVRKSDLQQAIDDMKTYVDAAIVGHGHTGYSGFEITSGHYVGGAPSKPTARGSSKVYAS